MREKCLIISKLCVGLTFYITLCCVVACLFLCECSKKKETSWCREKTGREVMKQEERLLKRGRGDGKVQVFDKTCTFFCVCRKFVISLRRDLKNQQNVLINIAMKAKPFIKWVGGKTQLIEQIIVPLAKNSKQSFPLTLITGRMSLTLSLS